MTPSPSAGRRAHRIHEVRQSRRAPGPRARIGAALPRPTRQRSPAKMSRSRRGGRAPRPKPPYVRRWRQAKPRRSTAFGRRGSARRRRGDVQRPARGRRGRGAARRGAQDRRRGRYQLLARRRQLLIEGFRAPAVAVGRPSVEARAWKACASPPPRIARPELRQGPASALQPAVWRLAALCDRYRPISRLAPLGHDQFLGSPRAGGRSTPGFSLRPDGRDPSASSAERCASAGRRRPR